MNKLLQMVEENKKEFKNKYIESNSNDWDRLKAIRTIEPINFIKKARIKELEILIKTIWKKNKPWGGDSGIESDRQVFGYNEALSDITDFLQDTTKELKK